MFWRDGHGECSARSTRLTFNIYVVAAHVLCDRYEVHSTDVIHYPDGCWKLDIRIPPNYPLSPPEIRFATPICHPNVHFKVRPHHSPCRPPSQPAQQFLCCVVLNG